MASNGDDLFVKDIQKIQKQFIFYWAMIVFNLGFVLNIFSIVVFLRRRFHNNSNAMYNILIALASNCSILIYYLILFPQSMDFNFLKISDFSCKINSFLLRVFLQLVSWLNVVVSFDRMIIVLYPYTHPKLTTNRIIDISFMLLFVFISLMNGVNLWFKVVVTQSIFNNNTNTSFMVADCIGENVILNEARDMIAIIMRNLLPFVLMLVSNSALIRGLFKQKRSLNLNRSMKREMNISVSVIAQNIMFILFMTPIAIALIYQYNSQFYTIQKGAANSTRTIVLINLLILISACLATFTICFPFIVNFLFNKLFRKEFLFIVKSIFFLLFSRKKVARFESNLDRSTNQNMSTRNK